MKLCIVVPCYNESEVLPETVKRLTEKMSVLTDSGKLESGSKIVFVDDGSKDGTWELIEKYRLEFVSVEGIKLS